MSPADIVRDAEGRFAEVPGGRGSAFLASSRLAPVAEKVKAYGLETGKEQLAAVDPRTGETLFTEDGDAGMVTGTRLYTEISAGTAMAVVHNHPHGLPLAENDIDLLRHANIDSVTAVGHDGSSYMVTRGEKFNETTFLEHRHDVVAAANTDLLVNAHNVSVDERHFIVQHVMNLALTAAGDMRYDYELSDTATAMLKSHKREVQHALKQALHAAKVDTKNYNPHQPRDKGPRKFLLDALEEAFEHKAKSDAAKLEAALNSFDWTEWDNELKPLLEEAFTAIVEAQGEATAEALNIAFNTADPFMQRELTDYIGERIKELRGTTKQEVSDLIRSTLDQPGRGPESTGRLGDLIRDKVREKFVGYEDWRADRIARTETAIAYNHGTVFAARQAGVQHVQVLDGTQDDLCREANGKIWTLRQALDNPVAHPHCQRAFAPIPPSESNA